MRYKHVFPNAELFHMGVHRTLNGRPFDERNARNSTGYVGFRELDENRTRFYSYERCLAVLHHRERVAIISNTSRHGDIEFEPCWIRNAQGQMVKNPRYAIWNAQAWHVHQYDLRSAIPNDWHTLKIPDADAGIDEQTLRHSTQADIDRFLANALERTNEMREYEQWLETPEDERDRHMYRPSDPQYSLNAAREAVEQWNRLASHMGWTSTVTAELDGDAMERIEQAIRDREEIRQREERERQRREQRAYVESKHLVKQWLDCEINQFPHRFHYRGGPTLLRLNGNRIETSHGAWFPVRHGMLAFKAIMRQVRKGENWQATTKAIPMGHYKLTSIARNGDRMRDWHCVAGCHTLKLPQIMPIARKLALI